MNPRDRRLQSDLMQMNELADRGSLAFRCEGDPPDTYHLMINRPGLAMGEDGELVVRNTHRATAYLHLDYPRRPPVVTWLTPVFHPNLLGPDKNGGVCVGSWSASESLADLCVRLVDLVSYRSLNPNDALNLEAAAWVNEHDVQPGTSVAELAQIGIADEVVVARVGG